MDEVKKTLEVEITLLAKKFLEKSNNQEIQIISHFDTDGITSAAIMIQSLKKIDQKFSIQIVKNLENEFIEQLPKDKITVFLDLASGSLNHISEAGFKEVFIIDHHEITQEVPSNINIVNPELICKQKISGSGLTYLFCKELDESNKEFAKLAILGMIGDMLDKEIDTLNNGILEEGDIKRKRGLMIYPSTRPLNRTLEYCSNPYIPGVTGDIKGVLELLRETGLNPINGKYKSLIELNDKEMEKLFTAIMLRNPKTKDKEIVGDIFLLKMFNKLEDARELSAIINACSRFGESETAIQYCMEIPKAKKRASSIHVKYKQSLVSGLKFVSDNPQIQGKGFLIINAQDKIMDTMIGTIASIISMSSLHEEGTVIVGMANYGEKIKISARNAGRTGRNVREVLARVMNIIGGDEVGGHKFAAGCLISKDKEEEFIECLKKHLEIEMVKI